MWRTRKTHRNFSFRNLLEAQASKVEVIVTFFVIEADEGGKRLHLTRNTLLMILKIESKMAVTGLDGIGNR